MPTCRRSKLQQAALKPASLNAAAAALGPGYNIFSAQGGTCPVGAPVDNVCATAPAFIRYRPHPYLRPFDLGFLRGVRV